jgi:rare lipoprotein A
MKLLTASIFRALIAFIFLFTLLLLSGCGHSGQARVEVPPPPPPVVGAEQPPSQPSSEGDVAKTPNRNAKDNRSAPGKKGSLMADLAEPSIPPGAMPLSTETGLASWYGPPYHNRRGSNGEVYNMNAMTAAHRTLPLESIVRITNVKTGHSALVRITDRGPFIPGRIVDLSLAAARKVDIVKPGVAEVKLELMQTPSSAETGGRWAVQIGSFADENSASSLASRLARRYRTAKVIHFSSPAGDWWVRVRVRDDDHARAQQLAAETRTPQGAIFLVRLD